MFRLSGILLLALSAAACRRPGGEAVAPEAGPKRQAHSQGQEPGAGTAGAKGRREEPEHLAEPDSGMVILSAAALDCLYPICSDHDGELKLEIVGKLGLSDAECQALDGVTRGLTARAKTEQLEPLGPLEFPLDQTVVIPPLALEKMEACVEDFTAALPGHLPEATTRLMVQMFRKHLEVEYGDEMRITLRKNASVSISDLRHAGELLGVKFEIVRGSRSGGGPVHHSPVQREGTRFDFMKVPPGVKGMDRSELFKSDR